MGGTGGRDAEVDPERGHSPLADGHRDHTAGGLGDPAGKLDSVGLPDLLLCLDVDGRRRSGECLWSGWERAAAAGRREHLQDCLGHHSFAGRPGSGVGRRIRLVREGDVGLHRRNVCVRSGDGGAGGARLGRGSKRHPDAQHPGGRPALDVGHSRGRRRDGDPAFLRLLDSRERPHRAERRAALPASTWRWPTC